MNYLNFMFHKQGSLYFTLECFKEFPYRNLKIVLQKKVQGTSSLTCVIITFSVFMYFPCVLGKFPVFSPVGIAWTPIPTVPVQWEP